MSKKSTIAKIDFILELISNINKVVKRHNGIINSLQDFEGQMAILMAISQIGETLKNLDNKIIEKYNLQKDRDGAYYTRNYIVHDYEGIDLGLIENIVREYLPKMKKIILKIQLNEKG